MRGLKGNGAFQDFGKEVPKLAQQFLGRAGELKHSSGNEIALFEPKRSNDHLEGYFYVGFLVDEKVADIPEGMHYRETGEYYVMTRGSIHELSKLHANLLKWSEEQGYKRDLTQYIVETYHPVENGEEVEIYLPIQM